MATHVHTRSSTRNRHHLPRLLFFKGAFLDILLLRCCCCCIIIYIYRRIACLPLWMAHLILLPLSLPLSLSISSLGSWESPLHTCRLATAVTHSAAEEEPPSLVSSSNTKKKKKIKRKIDRQETIPPWRHFPSSSQSRNSDNERLYREYTSYIFLYSHSRDERKKYKKEMWCVYKRTLGWYGPEPGYI